MADAVTTAAGEVANQCNIDYAKIAAEIEEKFMSDIAQKLVDFKPWIIGIGTTGFIIILLMFLALLAVLIFSCVDACKNKKRWGNIATNYGMGYKKLPNKRLMDNIDMDDEL